MTVSSYSTTASSNTAINGVNISEGMSPSDVNNAIREQLKDVRSVWNDKEWFLLGDGDGTTTFTRASATSVTVASNITSTHHVGRRVKIVGSNTGTIYGMAKGPLSKFPLSATSKVTRPMGLISNEMQNNQALQNRGLL